MVDLKSQYEKIRTEVNAGIQEVIDSTAFIKGGKVPEFQKNLEKYLHVKHVIPVGSGTDALQIALMALELSVGDEVIIPTFTFVAAAEVVALLGLTPVLVDVDKTFTICTEAIKKAITPRTKAIIPVHLFGQNADMESILQLAHEHNLYVIEDACQSIGSVYTFTGGKQAQSGCMGTVGCTSFFPSKNLGCYGDGGAIFTNNDELAKKMRTIANHGMNTQYYYDMVGVNSRLDSIQAAILNVKLEHLNEYIAARRAVANFYDKAFAGNPNVEIPARNPKSTHVFHQYTVQLRFNSTQQSIGEARNALQKSLEEKGIPTMIYYPVPLHLQKAYNGGRYKKGDFPVAETLCDCVLSLPMHTELSEEQLRYIVDVIICLKEKT